MKSAPDRGFTLLEIMVALAIFSVCAVVLLQQSGRSSRQILHLENRALAGWVAENELQRLRLSTSLPATGNSTQKISMGQREWQVSTIIEATTRPDLRLAKVTVSREESPGSPLLSLTAYLGEH